MSENISATRRTVIFGAGVTGIVAVAAACGGTDTAGADAPSAGASSAGGTTSSGGALGSTADIPVGGGAVFKDQKVVVTQPESGTFKAFSAVCTHQGCTVASVAGGTIDCACHGSKFSASDGSVKQGPASKPLASVAITVAGDQITLS